MADTKKIAEAALEIVYQFIAPNNFEELTLTKTEIKEYGVAFVAILSTISLFGVIVFGNDAKRFAWLISLVNSFLLTWAGAIYCLVKIYKYPGIVTQQHNDISVFQNVDNFSALVCLWFGLANIFDLMVGSIFYRKYVGLLTGWFHHAMFTWMMYAGTTGITPYGTIRPFASIFIIVCVEELPTFMLSLGSMFPALRTDMGFGITFFLLRCCLHFYMFIYMLRLSCDGTVVGVFVVSLSMHFFWFYSWISKYAFPKKKRDAVESGKKSI
jgi:hypothetical protein